MIRWSLFARSFCPDCPEKFAKRVRRSLAGAFGARATDQAGETGAVGQRMRGQEAVEGIGVDQQFVAPAFGDRELLTVAGHAAGPMVERGLNWCRIDVTHELPDVLQLSSPAFVRANAAGLANGIDQPFGQVEQCQAFRIERDQRLAQVLQCVHFLFSARLGRRQVQVRIGVLLRLRRRHRLSLHTEFGGASAIVAMPFAMITDPFLRTLTGPVPIDRTSCRTARPKNPPMTPELKTTRDGAKPRQGASAATSAQFPVSASELERVATIVLDAATGGGASAAETEVSQAIGQSVTVRHDEVETINYNRDKGIGVTVYVDQRRGHASSADFSDDAIRAMVRKALAIARQTAQDPAAGLADPARLARDWPDLDLYHPWLLPVEAAIELGREAEAAARRVDASINNSDGATVARGESEFIYANSLGFTGGYRSSRHHIDCSVIGERDGAMQRDYWYTAARAPGDLQAAAEVGRIAGERTVRRLGARQLGTLECPVIFEAPEAADLLGYFVAAVSGGSLYRRTSFLQDSLGQQVFAPLVQLREEPHLPRGRGSAPFDSEGVATAARDVVRDGVVQGYFLGSYSARKLGMATTGNGGGSHNLVLTHGEDDLAGLMRRAGRGLLVTEQLGSGVNSVTGDFSRGAAGFWFEDGAIAFPVEEITIAGNLKQMFRDIVAVGSDVDRRGARHTGSILVARMTIAGH